MSRRDGQSNSQFDRPRQSVPYYHYSESEEDAADAGDDPSQHDADKDKHREDEHDGLRDPNKDPAHKFVVNQQRRSHDRPLNRPPDRTSNPPVPRSIRDSNVQPPAIDPASSDPLHGFSVAAKVLLDKNVVTDTFLEQSAAYLKHNPRLVRDEDVSVWRSRGRSALRAGDAELARKLIQQAYLIELSKRYQADGVESFLRQDNAFKTFIKGSYTTFLLYLNQIEDEGALTVSRHETLVPWARFVYWAVREKILDTLSLPPDSVSADWAAEASVESRALQPSIPQYRPRKSEPDTRRSVPTHRSLDSSRETQTYGAVMREGLRGTYTAPPSNYQPLRETGPPPTSSRGANPRFPDASERRERYPSQHEETSTTRNPSRFENPSQTSYQGESRNSKPARDLVLRRKDEERSHYERKDEERSDYESDRDDDDVGDDDDNAESNAEYYRRLAKSVRSRGTKDYQGDNDGRNQQPSRIRGKKSEQFDDAGDQHARTQQTGRSKGIADRRNTTGDDDSKIRQSGRKSDTKIRRYEDEDEDDTDEPFVDAPTTITKDTMIGYTHRKGLPDPDSEPRRMPKLKSQVDETRHRNTIDQPRAPAATTTSRTTLSANNPRNNPGSDVTRASVATSASRAPLTTPLEVPAPANPVTRLSKLLIAFVGQKSYRDCLQFCEDNPKLFNEDLNQFQSVAVDLLRQDREDAARTVTERWLMLREAGTSGLGSLEWMKRLAAVPARQDSLRQQRRTILKALEEKVSTPSSSSASTNVSDRRPSNTAPSRSNVRPGNQDLRRQAPETAKKPTNRTR